MIRRRNIQHGHARRHPVSPAWPALGGVLLAVAVAIPFVRILFGAL